jgi:hypothetical protein
MHIEESRLAMIIHHRHHCSSNMATNPPILIPRPYGPYAVGVFANKLTDEARTDPFDPKNDKRAVMISLFFPIDPVAVIRMHAFAYTPPRTTRMLDSGLWYFGIPPIFERFKLHMVDGTP